MDKEKEIEKMAEFIGETLSVRHEGDRFPLTVLTRNFFARRIINAGYRKADEVRKETAKEVIARVREETYKYLPKDEDFEFVLNGILQEYGVEVDE